MLVKISLKFPQVTETSLTQAHFLSNTLIVTGPSPSGHHLYLLWWCLSHMDLRTVSKKHYPPQLKQSIIKTSVSPLLFIWDHFKTNIKCIHNPLFFHNRILFDRLYCIYCICNHLNYLHIYMHLHYLHMSKYVCKIGQCILWQIVLSYLPWYASY